MNPRPQILNDDLPFAGNVVDDENRFPFTDTANDSRQMTRLGFRDCRVTAQQLSQRHDRQRGSFQRQRFLTLHHPHVGRQKTDQLADVG